MSMPLEAAEYLKSLHDSPSTYLKETGWTCVDKGEVDVFSRKVEGRPSEFVVIGKTSGEFVVVDESDLELATKGLAKMPGVHRIREVNKFNNQLRISADLPNAEIRTTCVTIIDTLGRVNQLFDSK